MFGIMYKFTRFAEDLQRSTEHTLKFPELINLISFSIENELSSLALTSRALAARVLAGRALCGRAGDAALSGFCLEGRGLASRAIA